MLGQSRVQEEKVCHTSGTPYPSVAFKSLRKPADPPVSQIGDGVLYISSRGSLLRRANGDLPWYHYLGEWYRVLTPEVYVWLRQMLWQFSCSQDECDENVMDEIYDCANSLALAKWAGLQSGVFTEQNVSYDLTPRPDFRWSEGFPEELDVEYFED